jgi:hypothetical protein
VKKTGERGGLGDVEVLRALAEVGLGRRLRAVRAVPEVYGVQVGGKDLVFGVLALVGEGASAAWTNRLRKEVSKRSPSAT